MGWKEKVWFVTKTEGRGWTVEVNPQKDPPEFTTPICAISINNDGKMNLSAYVRARTEKIAIGKVRFFVASKLNEFLRETKEYAPCGVG